MVCALQIEDPDGVCAGEGGAVGGEEDALWVPSLSCKPLWIWTRLTKPNRTTDIKVVQAFESALALLGAT